MNTVMDKIINELNTEHEIPVLYHDYVTEDGKVITNVPYQCVPSYNEPLLNFNTLHHLEKIFRYMIAHDVQEVNYTEN